MLMIKNWLTLITQSQSLTLSVTLKVFYKVSYEIIY